MVYVKFDTEIFKKTIIKTIKKIVFERRNKGDTHTSTPQL